MCRLDVFCRCDGADVPQRIGGGVGIWRGGKEGREEKKWLFYGVSALLFAVRKAAANGIARRFSAVVFSAVLMHCGVPAH